MRANTRSGQTAPEGMVGGATGTKPDETGVEQAAGLSLITKSVPPVCTKSVPLGNSKLVNIVEMSQEIFDSITFT